MQDEISTLSHASHWLLPGLCRARFALPHFHHLAQPVCSGAVLDRYLSSRCSTHWPCTWLAGRALHPTIQAHTPAMAGVRRALACAFPGRLPAFYSRNELARSFPNRLCHRHRFWDATPVKSFPTKFIIEPCPRGNALLIATATVEITHRERAGMGKRSAVRRGWGRRTDNCP